MTQINWNKSIDYILNKDIIESMRVANNISKTTGYETGFCLYYNGDHTDINRYELHKGPLCIGEDSYSVDVCMGPQITNYNTNPRILGDFHVHAYFKNLGELMDKKVINENQSRDIVEFCDSFPHPLDLIKPIEKIINSNDVSATFVLSDLSSDVSCYIPNHTVPKYKFKDSLIKFENEGGEEDIGIIECGDGKNIILPESFKYVYSYIYDLFYELRFDINSIYNIKLTMYRKI